MHRHSLHGKAQAAVTPALAKDTLATVVSGPMTPDTKYSHDDMFRFVVWSLQHGREVHFDFRSLKGGPYGYALPATIVWGFDKHGLMVHGRIMRAGYPSIAFGFPAAKTQAMVEDYLRKPFFERLQYIDRNDFKVVVATRGQIADNRLE